MSTATSLALRLVGAVVDREDAEWLREMNATPGTARACLSRALPAFLDAASVETARFHGAPKPPRALFTFLARARGRAVGIARWEDEWSRPTDLAQLAGLPGEQALFGADLSGPAFRNATQRVERRAAFLGTNRRQALVELLLDDTIRTFVGVQVIGPFAANLVYTDILRGELFVVANVVAALFSLTASARNVARGRAGLARGTAQRSVMPFRFRARMRGISLRPVPMTGARADARTKHTYGGDKNRSRH